MCLSVDRAATMSLLRELQMAGSEGMAFWKGVSPKFSEDGTKLMSPIRRDFEWLPGLNKATDQDEPTIRVMDQTWKANHHELEIVEGGALHVYRQKSDYWGTPLRVWGRYDDFVAANQREACFTSLWITTEDWDTSMTLGQQQALDHEMQRIAHVKAKAKKKLFMALSNKVHGTKFKV